MSCRDLSCISTCTVRYKDCNTCTVCSDLSCISTCTVQYKDCNTCTVCSDLSCISTCTLQYKDCNTCTVCSRSFRYGHEMYMRVPTGHRIPFHKMSVYQTILHRVNVNRMLLAKNYHFTKCPAHPMICHRHFTEYQFVDNPFNRIFSQILLKLSIEGENVL